MLLRPAEPADAMAVARCTRALRGKFAYRNLLPDDYLEQPEAGRSPQRYTFGGTDPLRADATVAVDDRGTSSRLRDDLRRARCRCPGYGELACDSRPIRRSWAASVGVRSASPRARAFLPRSGFRRRILWVSSATLEPSASNLKDSCGTRRHASARTTVWGLQVNDLRYRRRSSYICMNKCRKLRLTGSTSSLPSSECLPSRSLPLVT
jgi:hypothetical protein